jgi:hypothetical protein
MRMRVVSIWRANTKATRRPMNEFDVVRVKNTIRAEEMIYGSEVEIKAGWEGTIVADADTLMPMVEFTEYSDNPILANLEATNLEVIWESR